MSQRYIGGLIYNPPGGFSGYFDGSGDFLDAGTNAALGFGTGDFTVEAWIYRNASGTFPIYTNGPASSGSWAFYVFSDKLQTDYYGGTSLAGATSIPLNTWNHVAVVRSGSTLSIYLNGNRDATTTTSSNNTTSNGVVGRDWTNGSGSPNGYISNFRVVKGTAVYSGTSYTVPTSQLQAISGTSLLTCAYPTFRDGSSNNFTITVNGNTAVSTQNPFPQTQLPNPALGNQGNGVYSMSQYQALRSQNLWPAIDPYFDYVTLMLHGNGTNGAQNNTFLDSSTNNFTITRNGNTTQGTFTPYGSNWSNYFDGSGDYLSISNTTALDLPGDFTIELWWCPMSLSGTQSLFGKWGSSQFAWLVQATSSNIILQTGTGGGGSSVTTISNAWSPTVGQWYHLAFTRSGTDIRAYVNGSQVGTTQTSSRTCSSTATTAVGANPDGPQEFTTGYISNARVVKGTVVYTANFTPPVNPLTVISGTSLLTCADNRFIDDSTNNFTITRNGDVSVQRFSPFAPTTPYAAGTIGGSGYFDGSGDYLSVADNAALDMGSSDFTIEGWVYVSAASGSLQTFIAKGTGANNQASYDIALNGSTWQYYLSGNGATWSIASAVSMGTGVLNSWTHLALVRNGNTFTPYVNGVAGTTTTSSTALFDSNKVFSIGADDTGASLLNGYISNVRVVKGTAVYTSAFTPPAAPLTSITNTSLLTNFTNAGIIDNAMMNDLETVGNAQISTSVSKFGGGSLSLNGSSGYLKTLPSDQFSFGTGNFTIEGWFYLTSSNDSQCIVDFRASSGSSNGFFIGVVTGGYFQIWNGTNIVYVNAGIGLNQWYYFAVARNGSTLKVFLNGSEIASVSNSTNWSSRNLSIGFSASGAEGLTGYIDDLRITRGYARYTANFTPQRSQWQDQ